MSDITILTPTYNREKLLHKLYKSLCNQKDKDFEWIVVDDGSNDNTDEYIETIQKKADFPIRYYKKNNGGKHTALNYGCQYVKTKLVFIVDSDDTLTDDAILTIQRIYEKI